MLAQLRTRVPPFGALVLYALSLVIELPVLLTRMLLAYITITLLLLITGLPTGAASSLSELALLPTVWAIFALITPAGGGWWWRQHAGGREPSGRERLAYQDAIDLLQAHVPIPLRLPKHWFVIDTPSPDAAVCGNALMLTRGLLETDHLPAVLAHELGHLNSTDGKLTAALNRLIINPPPPIIPQQDPPRQEGAGEILTLTSERVTLILLGLRAARWAIRMTLWVAKGGLGLRLISALWGSYWREHEYHADQYAATLGQGDELADFLEIHGLIHDQPLPFIWLTDHTHPPTELRIDKLRTAAQHETKTPQQPPATPAHDTTTTRMKGETSRPFWGDPQPASSNTPAGAGHHSNRRNAPPTPQQRPSWTLTRAL